MWLESRRIYHGPQYDISQASPMIVCVFVCVDNEKKKTKTLDYKFPPIFNGRNNYYKRLKILIQSGGGGGPRIFSLTKYSQIVVFVNFLPVIFFGRKTSSVDCFTCIIRNVFFSVVFLRLPLTFFRSRRSRLVFLRSRWSRTHCLGVQN